MADSFRWFSPLGGSVLLFLIIGFLWILIGSLTVPLLNRHVGRSMLFVSPRTDEAYFGGESGQLLENDPVLKKLRTMLLTVIAGFLLLAGVLFVAVAWFGVRDGRLWALLALSVSGVLAVVVWGIALRPYLQAHITLGLGDLPPFIWVPGLLILPALALGLFGLR